MSTVGRTIDDLQTGDEVVQSEKETIMSYIYSWGIILLFFWTTIAGAVLLYQFAGYFKPNRGGYGKPYQRGKYDDTNYLALGIVSFIIGILLTVATLAVWRKMYKKDQ